LARERFADRRGVIGRIDRPAPPYSPMVTSLADDTALTPDGDGRWRAELSDEWRIWTLNGGYLAAVLLRAASEHTGLGRPASLHCHLVGAGHAGPAEVTAEVVQQGRRASSIRLRMTQDGRPVMEALVWGVAGTTGVDFDRATPPDLPPPSSFQSRRDRGDDAPSYPFHHRLHWRSPEWLTHEEWSTRAAGAPRVQAWYALTEDCDLSDPWLDACRQTVLLDLFGWPAAVRALAGGEDSDWIAPNMDLAITFHQPVGEDEWLFLDGEAPVSAGGLVGALGRTWTADGRLAATAIQQMLWRNVAPPPLES